MEKTMNSPITVPLYYHSEQPVIVEYETDPPARSFWRTGLGIALMILSGISIGMACWGATFSDAVCVIFGSIVCASLFLASSLFIVFGECDISQRKCCLITSIVFNVFGIIAVLCSAPICTITMIVRRCYECHVIAHDGRDLNGTEMYGPTYTFFHVYNRMNITGHPGMEQVCGSTCQVDSIPLSYCLAVLTGMQFLLGNLLLVVASCNVCKCCKKASKGENAHQMTNAPERTPPYKLLPNPDYN